MPVWSGHPILPINDWHSCSGQHRSCPIFLSDIQDLPLRRLNRFVKSSFVCCSVFIIITRFGFNPFKTVEPRFSLGCDDFNWFDKTHRGKVHGYGISCVSTTRQGEIKIAGVKCSGYAKESSARSCPWEVSCNTMQNNVTPGNTIFVCIGSHDHVRGGCLRSHK